MVIWFEFRTDKLTFWDLDGRGASDLVDNGSGGETEHISI